MKVKLVAVEIKDDKTCANMFVCKNVDEQEYNKLLNQVNSHKQELAREKIELENTINELKETIEKLKDDIKELKGE